MFDEGEPSLLLYMLQQVAVPIASLVALILIVMACPFDSSATTGQEVVEVIGLVVLASVVGYIFGLATSPVIPSATSTGRWVWILPVLLLLWALLDESF